MVNDTHDAKKGWTSLTSDARHRAQLWRPFGIAGRVAISLIGGYFLSAGLAALLALPLSALMPRSEAVVLMAMLAFIIYLVVLLWAFAERRLAKLWLVLGGGALAVQSLVWWLSRAGGGG